MAPRRSRLAARAPRMVLAAIVGLATFALTLSYTVRVGRDAQAAGPAFRKGPYLLELGPNRVSLRFELDAPAPAQIEVIPTGADASASAAAAKPLRWSVPAATLHAVSVEHLAPRQSYRYRVTAGGTTEEGSFTTAPGNTPEEGVDDPQTFVLYGDSRTDDLAHAAVIRGIFGVKDASFLVNTGDLVTDGASERNWQTFFEIEGGLLRRQSLFACVGNHELTDSTGNAYLKWIAPSSVVRNAIDDAAKSGGSGSPARLFWTFRWGSMEFFLLNAFDRWSDGPEREWLEKELTRSRSEPGVRWRIAVMHQGPYSSGPHLGSARMLQAQLPTVFRNAGVDVLFSGHDHIYERGFSDGLRYVVSGGAGAPLYPIDHVAPGSRKSESAHHFVEVRVTPEAMRFVVRRLDGSLLEDCGFTKSTDPKAGWDCDTRPSIDKLAAEPTHVAAPTPPPSRCACRAAGLGTRPGPRETAAGTSVLLLLGLASLRTRAGGRRRRGQLRSRES